MMYPLTPYKLTRLLNFDYSTVKRWVTSKKLRVSKTKTSKRNGKYITKPSLIAFAKKHPCYFTRIDKEIMISLGFDNQLINKIIKTKTIKTKRPRKVTYLPSGVTTNSIVELAKQLHYSYRHIFKLIDEGIVVYCE